MQVRRFKESWHQGRSYIDIDVRNLLMTAYYRKLNVTHDTSSSFPRCGPWLRQSSVGTDPEEQSKSGSVLILALWALFFLTSLVMAVGMHVSGNLILAAKLKTGMTAYYLANAGVERAIFEIVCDSNAWDDLTESWSGNEAIFKDISLVDCSFCVSYSYASLSGEAVTNYGVVDEERKININKASKALLKSLIETVGEVDLITASEISSSIIDWRDENDEMLSGGAENSYYMELSRPYSCHNGEFQSLYELLLVKGVGHDLFSKLKQHLTIYGTGKVNINTADPVVLKCLAESCGSADLSTCESLVMKIVRFRDAGNTFMKLDISVIAGQLDEFVGLLSSERALLSGMMDAVTIRSTCFHGVAGGKVTGQSMYESRIAFVFDRDRQMKLYWHE